MAYGETSETDAALRLLVHAPFGRDASVLGDLARSSGIVAEVVRSAQGLGDAMSEGYGAVVLTEEALGPGLGLDLAAFLKGQPHWSEAPILGLVDHAARPPEGLRALRTSGVRIDLLLLERPLGPDAFVSAARTLIAARRAQYVIRDQIEELQAQNERLRFLMRELDHRVKNVLTKVSAIASLSSGQARDVQSFTVNFSARIAAMARAHDMLAGDRSGCVSLRDIVWDAVSPFVNPDHTNIHISGPNVEVWQLGGLTLAMVLHELATNAAKYGALSVPAGKIDISWEHRGSAVRKLHLDWQESGGPPVVRPQRRSFGTTLIETLAPHELDADVELDFAPDGVRCGITFPLQSSDPAAGRPG